jgi:hypothetical protein
MRCGVPLWMLDVGGAIDPDNEMNGLIVSVSGDGASTSERDRLTRPRAATPGIPFPTRRWRDVRDPLQPLLGGPR